MCGRTGGGPRPPDPDHGRPPRRRPSRTTPPTWRRTTPARPRPSRLSAGRGCASSTSRSSPSCASGSTQAKLKPMTTIPSETHLVQIHGVARETVRQALARLPDEGGSRRAIS
ncbi:GntR family transcriptional regulator [Nonomuraea roseola]|uniref:GntR family transcriptional regulator n=1 Tax=Nonomuraea roseola TaxID=46179 RepID=A0ABV5PXY4_9ACTN